MFNRLHAMLWGIAGLVVIGPFGWYRLIHHDTRGFLLIIGGLIIGVALYFVWLRLKSKRDAS